MSTSTNTDTAMIANTIRTQITNGVLMSLGARDFRSGMVAPVRGTTPLPSLVFNATILPFTKTGIRAETARTMNVVVSLNGRDTYDVHVSYNQRGDRYGMQPPVVHFEADDVPVENLAQTMLALDYDGDETLNPRYA